MATGNELVQWRPTEVSSSGKVSGMARTEVRNNQFMWTFGAGEDNEIILDGFVSDRYAATTGFSVRFCWGIDVPGIAGNVVWTATLERMQASTAANLHSADNWGTEYGAGTAGAIDATNGAAPTTAGFMKYQTIAIPKATPGATVVANERFRLRLRRKGTTATDTCKYNALVAAVQLFET